MKREEQKVVVATVQAAESVERGKARTVVAALDESSFADDVFDFLSRNFNTEDSKIVFTYVAKPVDSLFKSYAANANEAQAKKYLAEGWVKRAAELKLDMQCEGRVLVGDAREELLLFCEHLQPDLLVIGSHGRGPLGRMMLGSVSDFLVHHCPCAVVVVKAKQKEKEKEKEEEKEKGKEKEKGGSYSSVFRLMEKGTSMLSFRKKGEEGGKKEEEGEAKGGGEAGEEKKEGAAESPTTAVREIPVVEGGATQPRAEAQAETQTFPTTAPAAAPAKEIEAGTETGTVETAPVEGKPAEEEGAARKEGAEKGAAGSVASGKKEEAAPVETAPAEVQAVAHQGLAA